MRLHKEFIRLPVTFDAAHLAREIAQFVDSDWQPDLPLVTVGDEGSMCATPQLARCPYVQEVLGSLRSPLGRTRLIRVDGDTPRNDASYYEAHRVRVHVPVLTEPSIKVICGGESVHMAAGEAWVLDPFRPHHLANPDAMPGIHLVADVVPSPAFWDPPDEVAGRDALQFESRNAPVVMSPAEQEVLVELLGGVPAVVQWFLRDWRELWHRHGESPCGWAQYRALLALFDASLEPLPERERVRELLVRPALNPELSTLLPPVVPQRRIERPVFIVSPPRAGSTLLLQTLWRSPTVFAYGFESHDIIEGIASLHPAQHGWESNRLTAEDATPEVAVELEARFLAELQARDGSVTLPPRVRMLEKTTKSLLRLPFLRALYPDARFVVLHRDPRAAISSLIEVWRAQTMVTYPQLPGWEGPGWTLTLVRGWRALAGKPLEEIAAHQWSEGMRILLDDLQSLDPASWCVVRYEAFIAEPQKEVERICAFADLAWDRRLSAPLPLSISALSEPSPDKWRRNGEALDRIADRIQPVADRAMRDFSARDRNVTGH
jgi:hypothetical protein